METEEDAEDNGVDVVTDELEAETATELITELAVDANELVAELAVDANELVVELVAAFDVDDAVGGVVGIGLQADRNTRTHSVKIKDHLPDIAVSPLLGLWNVCRTN